MAGKPDKPDASEAAKMILQIAMDLYQSDVNGSATIKDCVHIAIEATWICVKYEIEIQKGTR